MWKSTIIDVWLCSKYFSACYATHSIKELIPLASGRNGNDQNVYTERKQRCKYKLWNIKSKIELKTGMGKTGIWVTLALNKK